MSTGDLKSSERYICGLLYSTHVQCLTISPGRGRVLPYILYGFDQQKLIWYSVCFSPVGLWCVADVLSVSPSSEQTEGLLISV